MRHTAHGVIFMEDPEKTPGMEIRDPKLPAVRAEKTGNRMAARRRGTAAE